MQPVVSNGQESPGTIVVIVQEVIGFLGYTRHPSSIYGAIATESKKTVKRIGTFLGTRDSLSTQTSEYAAHRVTCTAYLPETQIVFSIATLIFL
jgi:hypothetical protein